MRLPAVALAMLAVAVMVRPAPAQDLPTGVFVETEDGPQEAGVYADRLPGGRMRLAVGTLDELQHVSGVIRILCNLPLLRVQSVWLSTARVLQDGRADRRQLTVRMRRLSFNTTVIQVAASEDPAAFRALLDGVGASDDNPALVFVSLRSGGTLRDYVIGVRVDE